VTRGQEWIGAPRRTISITLKDVGKTMVFDARPPFSVLKTLDTGPITNHVTFARNAHGTFAYVTVGGLNEVQVYRTDDFGPRRCLVIAPGTGAQLGTPVQIQAD